MHDVQLIPRVINNLLRHVATTTPRPTSSNGTRGFYMAAEFIVKNFGTSPYPLSLIQQVRHTASPLSVSSNSTGTDGEQHPANHDLVAC